MDDILDKYYKMMGRNDYIDPSSKKGKLRIYIEDQEFEDDDINQELEDGEAADCGLYEMDEDFPTPTTISDDDEIDEYRFTILQYCYSSNDFDEFKQKCQNLDYPLPISSEEISEPGTITLIFCYLYTDYLYIIIVCAQ